MSVAPTRNELPRSSGTILVVDDVQANVQLLKSVLARDSYTVVTASDGEEALALVATVQPDLVLMDVMMPKLGGYGAGERLKQNPATAWRSSSRRAMLIPTGIVSGWPRTRPRSAMRSG
jgi:CheY-like chemotaxis protein